MKLHAHARQPPRSRIISQSCFSLCDLCSLAAARVMQSGCFSGATSEQTVALEEKLYPGCPQKGSFLLAKPSGLESLGGSRQLAGGGGCSQWKNIKVIFLLFSHLLTQKNGISTQQDYLKLTPIEREERNEQNFGVRNSCLVLLCRLSGVWHGESSPNFLGTFVKCS